jgi:hypothetical protein
VPVFEGWNQITVKVTLNNMGENSQLRRVFVDRTAPEIVLVQPEAWPANTNQQIFEIVGHVVTDDDTTVFPLVVGGHPMSYTHGLFRQLVTLAQGTNEVVITAEDHLGNTATVIVTIIADWTPPTVEIKHPHEERYATGYGVINISGAVWNATRVVIVHGGVEYPADHVYGDWNRSGTWKRTLELGPLDVDVLLIARAYDHVGNVHEDYLTVHLDMLPPRLDVDYHRMMDGRGYWITGWTDPEIEAIELNGLLYPTDHGNISILITFIEGRNDLVLTAEDEVGNIATVTKTVWHDDNHLDLKVQDPPDRIGRFVIIEGTTDKNVHNITVDGTEYPVVDGRFRVEVRPGKDQDVIRVKVEDAVGNTRSTTVHVGGSLVSSPTGSVIIILVIVVFMMLLAFIYIKKRT